MDLQCSLCKRPRVRTKKLLAGNSGNICDKCDRDGAVNITVEEKECILCGDGSGPATSVCGSCFASSRQLFEKLSVGQTWIVRTNKAARSCKPHRYGDERKAFYKSALHLLSKAPLSEDSGDLLVDLFQIEPSKRLVRYARKWLHQFPNHQDGPRVLSFWLTHFRSGESLQLAANYLKEHQKLAELHWLMNSVLKGKCSIRLDRLLSERLEQCPENDVWHRCMSPYERRFGIANRLSLRWLELNDDNPNLLLMGFTFFAESPEVVAAVFRHFQKHGISSEGNEWEIRDLLDKAFEFKMITLPDVIRFSRSWLEQNCEHQMAASVNAGLVRASHGTDIENAKKWFLAHRTSSSSFLILNELMDRKDGEGMLDSFGTEEARKLVADTPVKDRPPALVGTLLNASPDAQTIAWAKETYAEKAMSWILIRLLYFSPDVETIEKARREMELLADSSISHEILYPMLKVDSSNARVKQLAGTWLKKNSRHKWAKAIRSRL